MKKPNLFILGAPKCGTTALSHWLSLHPDIYVSEVKEPHYFSEEHKLTPDLETYEKLFQEAGDRHRWVCEASVWYLFSDTAVHKIQCYSPDARFIVMLRNPVELSVSMHEQHKFNGNELVGDFREALSLSDLRSQGHSVGIKPGYVPTDHLAYYKSCSLGWQLSRLYQIVPKERIHVIMLDDIAADPRRTYISALEFLELSQELPGAFQKINPAKTRKSFFLDTLVLWLAKLKSQIGIRRRFGLLALLRRWNIRYVDRERLPADLYQEMAERFRPDVQLMGALLERDLEHWQTQNTSKNEPTLKNMV